MSSSSSLQFSLFILSSGRRKGGKAKTVFCRDFGASLLLCFVFNDNCYQLAAGAGIGEQVCLNDG